jgi:hypothetical protein
MVMMLWLDLVLPKFDDYDSLHHSAPASACKYLQVYLQVSSAVLGGYWPEAMLMKSSSALRVDASPRAEKVARLGCCRTGSV